LVNMLNESKLANTTEVVIAPAAVHLHKALAKVRPDVAVAAQDVWSQGGGLSPERRPPRC
jgi:triosephosphate isomerase